MNLIQRIEHTPIEDLVPYAANARTHSEDQVSQIAASIKEFGFNNPVLIDIDNGIIAGHGRVMAAMKLGLDLVPTVTLDHLSDAERRAYILADNRLALNAGWDEEILAAELKRLDDEIDLSLLGFDDDELARLLDLQSDEGLTDEDDVPELPETPKTVEGDVWLLGRHRLMCGDSTSIDAVEKLMNGQKADMVFTDPPYNIDYQGVSDKKNKIKNDNMSQIDFANFLIQSIMSCETMYVCCSWQYAHIFKATMEDIGKKPKAMIVWNKVNPAQHLDKYYKQHEVIFYHGEFGGQKTLREILEVKRQRNTVHPTMKPIELIDIAMTDQPTKKTVYDGFGGSGSTLISCQKNRKDCRMMELDPKYCDVIIKRWQDYTGEQATHEATGKTFDAVDDVS